MFLVDQLILLGGILFIIGTVSSKLSARLGLPVLVLFLAVGMLAGEDGPGGIDFDNVAVTHAIGTVALGLILFDGGLQTRTSALRSAWKPAALLATAGVLLTAAITGLAATYLLGMPLLTGLLLGSIVASTDAAAVFSVLRSQGVHLRERLSSILEIESGSNDPMAIFLTVGLIELIAGRITGGMDLVALFVMQMGVGAGAGLGVGWVAVRLINRITLNAPGLYPVLAAACGFTAFGLAAVFGGSGFLAIYLAGIVIGNSRLVFQRGTFFFMDGLAWMGQIAMFVVLGLLSTPTEVLKVAPAGLLIAGVLIFVARPLAMIPLLWPFRFSLREQFLIAWVGLKGAVPIILATFPLMYGLAEGRAIFNVVFFVVILSATLQGWTLPLLANRLGLQESRPPVPAVTLELLSLRDVNASIIDYRILPASPWVARSVKDLELPEGALVAMISRGHRLVAPRGSTLLIADDHLFIITAAEDRSAVVEALNAGPTITP